MAEEQVVFHCLVCERVTRVAARLPKCGECGSGNGVLMTGPRSDGGAASEVTRQEEQNNN